MAMKKQYYCKNGHVLDEPNIVRNTEGFRECRTCRYLRNNAWRRKLRRAIKFEREFNGRTI